VATIFEGFPVQPNARTTAPTAPTARPPIGQVGV
jgi:hypothetical protein